MNLIEMRDKAASLRNEAAKILKAVKEENRDITEAEETRYNNLLDERDRVNKLIAAEERLGNDDDGKAPERRTAADPIGGETRTGDGEIEVRWRDHDGEARSRVYRKGVDEGYERATPGYAAEFRAYMTGERTENRSFKLSQGDKGGYWAPEQTAAGFYTKVKDMVWLRQLAQNIDVVGAGSLGIVGMETDPGDADWTAEVTTTDASADSTAQAGKRTLTPHNLIKVFDVSRTMLRRVPNAEAFILDRLAYKVGVTEEKAFISGSGANQPLGVFTASDDGVSTARDVNLGSTSDFTADGLISVQMAVKPQYRRRAGWLLHRDSVARIRKLKVPSVGVNYLWVPGLGAEPDTLLGSPVYESEYAPNTYTSAQYGCVYGDFGRYIIATAARLEILRDDLSKSRQGKVSFVLYHESDGMPLLAEAFARGKFST